MLTLTTEQMAEFDALESERFEQRLSRHLLEHFPAEAAGQPADALQRFARRCTARAEQHGLGSERNAAIWAGIALLLGEDFVDHPACTWAREILEDPFIVSQTLRADLLHQRAREHLDAVEGARSLSTAGSAP